MATVFTLDSEAELELFLNTATLPASFGVIAKGAKFTVGGLDGAIISGEAQGVLDRISINGGTLTQTEEDALIAFVDREHLAGRWPTFGGAADGQKVKFWY